MPQYEYEVNDGVEVVRFGFEDLADVVLLRCGLSYSLLVVFPADGGSCRGK